MASSVRFESDGKDEKWRADASLAGRARGRTVDGADAAGGGCPRSDQSHAAGNPRRARALVRTNFKSRVERCLGANHKQVANDGSATSAGRSAVRIRNGSGSRSRPMPAAARQRAAVHGAIGEEEQRPAAPTTGPLVNWFSGAFPSPLTLTLFPEGKRDFSPRSRPL